MSAIQSITSEPLSPQPADVLTNDVYEPPIIKTYTEAELLAALGPAYAGSPLDGDSLFGEIPVP
jgi:hypothetical protein